MTDVDLNILSKEIIRGPLTLRVISLLTLYSPTTREREGNIKMFKKNYI